LNDISLTLFLEAIDFNSMISVLIAHEQQLFNFMTLGEVEMNPPKIRPCGK